MASSLFRPRWMTFGLFSEVFSCAGVVAAMASAFNLQGHRGARGLCPENTLPSFETAFDLGVTSVETDLHLTRDNIPVLVHDPQVSDRFCRLLPGSASPDPALRPLIRSLSLLELRGYRADRNPDPGRFPTQTAVETPLARWYAQEHGLDPYGIPSLDDLLSFVAAYLGDPGAAAGKTDEQRSHLRERLYLDLELKRVPFRPETIGDTFGDLERRVVECIRRAGALGTTVVRSFDHRSVQALRRLEPGLTTAILIAGTAPIAPAELVLQAGAQVYCPDYQFLDAAQVGDCHASGVRVVPWTVNDPNAWPCLLDWGVDGITTDYPDRLAALLRERGSNF